MSQSVASLNIKTIRREEVLRYLGYRGQEMTAELEARLEEATKRCLVLVRPRACLRLFDLEGRIVREDGVPELRLVDCALRLEGTSIAQHLADAVAVGVMAVTLGAGIDRELRRLSLTDPLGQVLFDAVATAAAEEAADAAEALLVDAARERELHTNTRFSPGYGDFPLSCQPTLLSVLDATRRLGITLTPSLLMVPTKSVTAVVGCFTDPQKRTQPGCAVCNLREYCRIRAQGATCYATR